MGEYTKQPWDIEYVTIELIGWLGIPLELHNIKSSSSATGQTHLIYVFIYLFHLLHLFIFFFFIYWHLFHTQTKCQFFSEIDMCD